MRLSPDILARLPDNVARPGYDRRRVTTGIVHLGLGAFCRAHMAVYTDAALAAGQTGWGILGASLRSSGIRDALAPQAGLYTVAIGDGEVEQLRVIGALSWQIVASRDPGALVAAMAAPGTRIVSLTITEKGYCHDPASGTLNQTHPDIVHDVAHPDAPRSAPGFIVAALMARRAAGLKPFTVLSCDNLPSNGRVTKRVLTALAGLVDPGLARYVADELACPSTMVDRIVPASTAVDRARISAALGYQDAAVVVTESFSQWVIEDDFPLGRPDWDAHGAQFVADVAPYETLKLRLLNGAHSALAYLGLLAGLETVAQGVAEPVLAAHLRRLMLGEIIPVLKAPPGTDLPAYAGALVQRFGNRGLQHRLAQIAMDGSQKLPQRLLETARDRLALGLDMPCLALSIAAWMRYVSLTPELRDPMGVQLTSIAARAGSDAGQLVISLLAVEPIFGRDLIAEPRFVSAVTAALTRLTEHGALATLGALSHPEGKSDA